METTCLACKTKAGGSSTETKAKGSLDQVMSHDLPLEAARFIPNFSRIQLRHGKPSIFPDRDSKW